MSLLLSLSRAIDRLNELVGRSLYWLILAAVLISAANAVVRKAFNVSSNSFLEIQWYLFSAVFLGAAGYTLLRNEHVRIDVIAGRLSRRAQTWIDILGTIFFLLPMAILIGWLAWPVFVDAYQRQEVSSNAGGLIVWPARLMVPIGFLLLALQGVSELIKRAAFLMGRGPDPSEKVHERTAEEQLAEEIRKARGEDLPTERSGEQAMSAFLIENIAPLMFLSLIVVLLLGYPVAFSLAAVGIGYALLGIHLGLLEPSLLQALPERVWGVMSNDTLLAVPFFTFMGLILERSGMAEDLLDTIGQVFGPVRGGLAYAVIFVGALLAATTGVVAASVISMGLISLPIMLRYGYDRRFASGVIAASGTLAQIIPPSLVLIIMADQLGKSVGDMYAGAFIPGITLACMYAAYALGVCAVKPHWAPALPLEARTLREPDGSGGTRSLLVLTIIAAASAVAFAHWKYGPDDPTDEMLVVATSVGTAVAFAAAVINKLLKLGLLSRLAERVVFALIPPLALIFLVLGTIFLGVATPTEGGAMGASGALIMALMRNRLSWNLLRQAMDTTAKLSTFVVFILVGARVFSLTFYGVNGHVWVEQLLLHLPGGQLGFLIVVNILIFFLAFFLDFFELSFIIIPLVGPVADKLGIDLIWFGVLLAVNMQTSFMHPPFGFALFYLRSVAPAKDYLDKVTKKLTPRVTTGQIYWGAVPFVLIQVVMVALVIGFPKMVMVYKANDKVFDPSKIRIMAPVEEPVPGGQPSGDINIEQDDATKALEKEMGGGGTGGPEEKSPVEKK